MWKSGSIKTESVSPGLPAPRSSFRGIYRLVLGIGILFVTVVFIFPLISKPGVEPVTEPQFGNPFSMAVQISNQNLTPLKDVEYSCEVSDLTLANGTAIRDAKVLVRGSIRKIQGNRAVTARCETAYVNAPVHAIEYRLTLTYRTYPWPQRHTGVYVIGAQIDGNGQIRGWKLR